MKTQTEKILKKPLSYYQKQISERSGWHFQRKWEHSEFGRKLCLDASMKKIYTDDDNNSIYIWLTLIDGGEHGLWLTASAAVENDNDWQGKRRSLFSDSRIQINHSLDPIDLTDEIYNTICKVRSRAIDIHNGKMVNFFVKQRLNVSNDDVYGVLYVNGVQVGIGDVVEYVRASRTEIGKSEFARGAVLKIYGDGEVRTDNDGKISVDTIKQVIKCEAVRKLVEEYQTADETLNTNSCELLHNLGEAVSATYDYALNDATGYSKLKTYKWR